MFSPASLYQHSSHVIDHSVNPTHRTSYHQVPEFIHKALVEFILLFIALEFEDGYFTRLPVGG